MRDGQPQRRHDEGGQQTKGNQQRLCAAIGDSELEGVGVGCPYGVGEAGCGHFGDAAEIEIWRSARRHLHGGGWLAGFIDASLFYLLVSSPFPPFSIV